MDKQAREIDKALPDVERVGEGIHLTLNEMQFVLTLKSTLTTQAKANLDKLIPVFTECGY